MPEKKEEKEVEVPQYKKVIDILKIYQKDLDNTKEYIAVKNLRGWAIEINYVITTLIEEINLAFKRMRDALGFTLEEPKPYEPDYGGFYR